jgi:acetoin utilization deacetylase AcuC-like enzyme
MHTHIHTYILQIGMRLHTHTHTHTHTNAERCTRVECPEVSLEALQAVHTGDLIRFVRALASEREGNAAPGAPPVGQVCVWCICVFGACMHACVCCV